MRYYLTQRVELHFTFIAYLKMRELVAACDKECAWHGVVTADTERRRFTVHDILVYPQTITSVTVEKDEEKYFQWHQALPDEEYNNLKLQGHSHVNMGVSPSGVDRDTYVELAETISNDAFYIFMITNKRHDYFFEILDKQNNVIYDKSDIDLFIGDFKINDWVKDSLKMLAERKPYTQTVAPKHWWNDPAQTPTPNFGTFKQSTIETMPDEEIPEEAYDDVISENGSLVNEYLNKALKNSAPKKKTTKKGAKKK